MQLQILFVVLQLVMLLYQLKNPDVLVANDSCKTGQSGSSWQIQQRCVQQENNLHRRKE